MAHTLTTPELAFNLIAEAYPIPEAALLKLAVAGRSLPKLALVSLSNNSRIRTDYYATKARNLYRNGKPPLRSQPR